MSKSADDFSRAFYPFLNEERREPHRPTGARPALSDAPPELIEELRFSLLEKARESVEVKVRFFDENKDAVLAASFAVAQAFQCGRKMLVCGNGGSATDAQHIAVEFMHPVTVGRKALPALCLSNDMAMVTAVANDVGFDDVFTRQIIALGREGDVLLGISTSGNSENLLHAFQTARRMKLITVGLAGGDGGKMAAMCSEGLLDFCLTVPTSSTHRIQETHVTLYHVMWDMVHAFLQRGALLVAESGDVDEGTPGK
ncbi:MAG: SIS domain-containing protein [Acidobacteria bacterium]|nr:SIS domain-containing protein [Acidobacteriota bacterium]